MRFLLVVLVMLVGCGEQTSAPVATETAAPVRNAPPPTAGAARALIETSPEFSEYQFTNAAYALPLAKSAMNAPALQAAAQLKAAKWIGFDGDGNVVLTQKAKDDKRFLVRQNGFVDIVPLAKKRLLAVDSVSTNDAGAPVALLRWQWVPNEIGVVFKTGMLRDRYTGEQKARATLLWDGSAWTVLKIEPS